MRRIVWIVVQMLVLEQLGDSAGDSCERTRQRSKRQQGKQRLKNGKASIETIAAAQVAAVKLVKESSCSGRYQSW